MGLFDDIPTTGGGTPSDAAPDISMGANGRPVITVRPRANSVGGAPQGSAPVSPADRDLMIRTVVGEAANQPPEGQAAVAHVILNRLNSGKFGNSVPNVVLAPYQFEPWQTRRPQLMALAPESPEYQTAANAVDSALNGGQDPTGGATHFLEPNIVRARRGGTLPDWAQGPSVQIGAHLFYAPGGKLNPVGTANAGEVDESTPAAAQGLFDDIPAPKAAGGPTKDGAGAVADLAKPKTSAGDAAASGLASGLTANFADEIAGVNNAVDQSGPRWLGPMRLPVGIARLLYENLISGPSGATRAYQEGRDKVRAILAQAQQDQPGAFLAGEIPGALASAVVAPEATVAKGAGLGARVANAAANGALYGTAAGAGAGEGAADTAKQAATGGVIGGVGGAVLAPVTEAVGQVASRALGGLTRNARDAAAARQVVKGIEADNPSVPDAASKAADAVERANANGVPLAVADTGGTVTQRLADSASIKSPAANKAFQDTFDARAATQKDRLSDEVRAIVGGDFDSTLAREDLQTLARQQNAPAYKRAYAAGDRPIWSPELERLTSAPSVLDALRGAQAKWKDWQVVDGFGGMNPPVKIAPGGTLKFESGGGLKTYPNIQFWDYAARDLADQAQAARDAGKTQLAARLGGLERQLKTELDKLVPEYGKARTGAAQFFGANDALEAGENFVGQRMQNTEAQLALSKMSPAERQLFAYGFASTLLKAIRETPDRANVTNRTFLNSPAAIDRIRIALGPDGARRIEAFIRLENMMQATKNAVTGNSKTMQRAVDAGIMGTGLGANLESGDWSPDSLGTMMIAGALAKAGRRSINTAIAERVGKLLASQDPQALRDAIQMAARNPGLLDAIRRADNLLPRVLSGTLKPNSGKTVLPAAAEGGDDKQ